MAIRCGVDIVEVGRIRRLIENRKSAFVNRIFTKREADCCESRGALSSASYAARFAAKEAVSKAFGTGIGSRLSWKEIEVLNDENGMPRIELSGNAARLFHELGCESISVSLSHSREYAVASVILEMKAVQRGGRDEQG